MQGWSGNSTAKKRGELMLRVNLACGPYLLNPGRLDQH